MKKDDKLHGLIGDGIRLLTSAATKAVFIRAFGDECKATRHRLEVEQTPKAKLYYQTKSSSGKSRRDLGVMRGR